MKILIVDDSLTVTLKTKTTLEAAGFEVFFTNDAHFLTICQQVEADLVLLDVQLASGVDGTDGIADFGDERPPIFLHSSLPEKHLNELVAIHGIEGWISKDGEDEDFLRAVRFAIVGMMKP